MSQLRSGSFTDLGFRFRKNYFQRFDEWQPLVESVTDYFFDYTFYSNDKIAVDLDHTAIAEYYFRIDVNEIRHTRIVFEFMDWLGSIGGVSEILF